MSITRERTERYLYSKVDLRIVQFNCISTIFQHNQYNESTAIQVIEQTGRSMSSIYNRKTIGTKKFSK